MSILIRAAIAAVCAVALAGCGAIPTMKYCDKVEYIRDGSRVTVKAECQAPIGGGVPGL